jgi:hypothetical protein
VDGAIDPTAAQQRGVGGIDDRIDGKPGDVAKFDADPVLERFRPRQRRPRFDSKQPGTPGFLND